jgi:hypothetical protein
LNQTHQSLPTAAFCHPSFLLGHSAPMSYLGPSLRTREPRLPAGDSTAHHSIHSSRHSDDS